MSDSWETRLPGPLKAAGKPVVDIPGAETAWPVKSAPELIQWLQAHKFAVLGGDYYVKKAKAFEPSYDNWQCELKGGEAWAAYIERSCAQALASLKKASPESWIVIVASAKPTTEQLVARRES
jgi:hypothetical protein